MSKDRIVPMQTLSLGLHLESSLHSFGKNIPSHQLNDNGADDYDASVDGWMLKTDTKYDGDRELFQVFTMEAFNRFGIEFDYHVVSYDKNYDRLFGEDNDIRLERVFKVMGYTPELPNGQKMWSAFGIDNDEGSVTIHISKMHFESVSSAEYPVDGNENGLYPTNFTDNYVPSGSDTGTKDVGGRIDNTRFSDVFDLSSTMRSYIPKVGDILRTLEWNNKIYVVTEVKEEEEEFLQAKHTWLLRMTEYKNDHPTTGLDNHHTKTTDVIESDEIFNVADIVELIKEGEEPPVGVVVDHPTTGKGKPKPLYEPKTEEKKPSDPFGGW